MTFTSAFRRGSIWIGLLGALGASLSGCGGGGGGAPITKNQPPPGAGGDPDPKTRDVCRANPAHSDGRARWTVLVYMNAANNLQPDSLTNIAQMASVGSDSNVNIVVQWKQANATPGVTPSFIGTRRYLIHKHSAADISAIQNSNTAVLDSDRLAEPATNNVSGQSDMGNWHVLQDFVQWGTRAYPADNLAVVLWDHGSGWLPTQYARSAKQTRAVSQDDEYQDEIETWQTPAALSVAAQPIDALIIDCSLEQMLEVAYEVRNSAKVMVGSEESPPGSGYPYDQWLTDLKANGSDPCTVGSSIVTRFVAAYPNESDITQSVLDLTHMQSVASAVDSFANSLLQHTLDQRTVIANARQSAQAYKYPENKDLFHFADLVRTTANTSDLQQAAAAVETTLRGASGAVLRNGQGPSQSNSTGLAIYIPEPGQYDSHYSNLALARAGAPNWLRFLQLEQQ